MKICPQCRTTYTDDNLRYCLQDGTNLIDAVDADTETPTVVLKKSENYDTNRNLGKIQTDVQDSPVEDWRQNEQINNTGRIAEPKSSKTLIAILATALAMLLLFAGAIGAWFYLRTNDSETVRSTNKNTINAKDKENKKVSPSPTPAQKDSANAVPTAQPTTSAEPTKSATPLPDSDAEQVKKDAAAKINSWKNAAESLDLNSYMNNYAQTVDFYNKKNATVDFVRRDKQRAFSAYDDIEMKLENIRVFPDITGKKATAIFDKYWNFSGEDKRSEGKVQTQLKLAKIGGEWKITGEKDLKVYYVK